MPEDSKGLADALSRMLTDETLAEELRKNGLKTAKEHAWDKTATRVEELFKEALTSWRPCH
jgi:glycosyltransferase involved in cell wall biosynthesis